MAKVAVILANGFEEIEALTVVDVLRRANITCHMLGFEQVVTGSHGISVQADRLWQGNLDDYDMVVLPGGMPGSANLRDDQDLMKALAKMENKKFTCYDGVEESIKSGNYLKETVVTDGKLITSRGPSTALAFAYVIVEKLGGDADSLRQGMLYTDVFGK